MTGRHFTGLRAARAAIRDSQARQADPLLMQPYEAQASEALTKRSHRLEREARHKGL
jgi:hypothetical protein